MLETLRMRGLWSTKGLSSKRKEPLSEFACSAKASAPQRRLARRGAFNVAGLERLCRGPFAFQTENVVQEGVYEPRGVRVEATAAGAGRSGPRRRADRSGRSSPSR